MISLLINLILQNQNTTDPALGYTPLSPSCSTRKANPDLVFYVNKRSYKPPWLDWLGQRVIPNSDSISKYLAGFNNEFKFCPPNFGPSQRVQVPVSSTSAVRSPLLKLHETLLFCVTSVWPNPCDRQPWTQYGDHLTL